jgi:pyridoxine 4-dehydrogenase
MINKSFMVGGDIEVSRMGFGAMRTAGANIWGMPDDVDNSLAVIKRAVALGINFIDTADSYGPNVSEELLARALKPYPDNLLIATKGGVTRPSPSEWVPDCSPQHLKDAIEGSLDRLRLRQIDLYQLHTVDQLVPFEDSLRALKELQGEGKIRHIGVSNVSLAQLKAALEIVHVVSVQNHYNVANRSSEDVLQECERLGIAFLPYFPLGGGGWTTEDNLTTTDSPLSAIAKKHNVTPGQIALAWLLHHSPVIIPIPGTASLDHLEENTQAIDIELCSDEVAQIEQLFPQNK